MENHSKPVNVSPCVGGFSGVPQTVENCFKPPVLFSGALGFPILREANFQSS